MFVLLISHLIVFASHSNHFSLGGVLLVGGQSGNTILGSLYWLKSANEKWELLKQKLETPRRYHIALTLPSSVVTSCSSTGTFLAKMLVVLCILSTCFVGIIVIITAESLSIQAQLSQAVRQKIIVNIEKSIFVIFG
jgi:hypothetical protein